MAARGGCLLLLLFLGLVAFEVWFALVASEWIYGEPEVFGALLAMAVLSVIGVQLLKWRMRRLAQVVMGGRPGPAVVGILGAVLITIPGFLTGAVGILCQLPPIQSLFGRLAGGLFAVVMRRAASRMGGAGGMPGGFPGGGFPGGGFPGGGFPGGFPFPPGGSGGLRPDQRAKRGGTVIDVEAERIEQGQGGPKPGR